MKQLVRKAWRLIPADVRRAFLRLLARVLRRPLDPARPMQPGPVIVAGFHGTATGLGQSARQMLSLFRAQGLPAYAANVSRFAIMEDFDAGDLWPADVPEGGIVIFHVNPDMLGLVMRAIGMPRLINRRIVGLWAWELGVVPQSWIDALAIVDEVWVPSQFIAEGLRARHSAKPVHVVLNYVDVANVPMQPRQDPLPDYVGRPLVFFMYDVRSNHTRKNPEAVIEAFQQATAGDIHPVLVIKINNDHAWPESLQRVQAATQGMPNALIIRDKLSPTAMQDLIARMDIMISLHRSEGFGFLMAEGMAAAKPVIATGWSGNMDFMTKDCSVLVDARLIPVVDPEHVYDKYNAVWAEPDVGQATVSLRRLLMDVVERQRLGQAARAHVAQIYKPANWMASLPESFWQALPSSMRRS